MAIKMLLGLSLLLISIIGINAKGELVIIQSPDSIKFSGDDELHASSLKNVFSAALGLSVDQTTTWNGMIIADPFNTPEAVVEVYVDGLAKLDTDECMQKQSFPLAVDQYEPDTYNYIQHRVKQSSTNGQNIIVEVKLSDINQVQSIFGELTIPQEKLNSEDMASSNEENSNFLKELGVLKAVTEKVNSCTIKADRAIDFFNFRFMSLHPLSDFHGTDSPMTKEAKKLLSEAVMELSNAFVKAYDGSVLVAMVNTDVAHTRRYKRSTTDEVYEKPDADYPAVFNIILWFVVALVFSLIAIVYTIMDMDPGRDSIIYRMTSTRMKKDN